MMCNKGNEECNMVNMGSWDARHETWEMKQRVISHVGVEKVRRDDSYIHNEKID
jgi:hypothetical protein